LCSETRPNAKPETAIANGKKSDMTQLNIKVALAMSLISMFLLTKWWFALPVDGPAKLYWGFPFAFMGEGFHTSMSYQFFIIEFIANFTVYFSFWVVLILSVNKMAPNFKLPALLSKIIWSLTLLFYIGFVGLISISNPIFHFKRPYDWEILETGNVFIWKNTPRPERFDFFSK
jgi:hypothetical protein